LIKTPEIERYLKFKRKIQVLNYAKEIGSVRKICDLFGISKNHFTIGRINMRRMEKKVLLESQEIMNPMEIELAMKLLS